MPGPFPHSLTYMRDGKPFFGSLKTNATDGILKVNATYGTLYLALPAGTYHFQR